MTTTRSHIYTGSLALIALFWLGACSGKPTADNGPDPVALVTLGQAETGGVDQTVSVYGVIDSGAGGTVTLAAPAEAIVADITAPVGTAITAGQVVVQLKPSPATQSDTIKAISDATAADATLARARRLRADNLNSDADVEAAAAAATAADSAAAAANTRVAALTLRASEAGYVVSVTPNPGDVVAAGATVATVSTSNALRARFGVDPALAQQVSEGALIHVTPADGAAFDAHVLSVSPVVDPVTHLAPVVAAIPPGTRLGSGQALRGDLTVSTASAALTIPYAALLDDGGQPYVFVVKNGVAHRVDVETGAHGGASDSDRIAIISGLSGGDQVVIQGGTALDDGMKVRVK